MIRSYVHAHDARRAGRPTVRALRLGSLAASLAMLGASVDARADTAVTSPADLTPIAGYGASLPTVAVTGTATSETAVDLYCAADDAGWFFSSPLVGGTNVPVTGGTFSAPAVELPYGFDLCRLVALPAGSAKPTSLDPVAGPYLGPRLRPALVSYLVDYATYPNVNYAFGASAPGSDALAWISSVSDNGVSTAELVTSAPGYAGFVFNGLNYLRTLDPVPANPTPDTTVTGLRVDDVNAYGASDIYDLKSGFPIGFSFGGLAYVQATPSIATDGTIVVQEHDSVVRCATGSSLNYYPPAGNTCTSLSDAGIAIDVTTRVTPGGERIERRWRLVATDGAQHAVHLVLRNDVDAIDSTHLREFRLPGETAYATHAFGDTFASPASGPFRIDVRTQGAADGDVNEGKGAMVFTQPATGFVFTGTRVLTGRYDVTVPATGAMEMAFVYCVGATQAVVDACADAATASVSPTLTVSAPLDASTAPGPTVPVTGTLHEASTSVVLTVGSSVVVPAGDGSFATTAPLVDGDNAIVVTATNAYGVQTTRTVHVTRGTTPTGDGGVDGGATPVTSSGGCSCSLAGDPSAGTGGIVPGALLALAALFRRRRRGGVAAPR